MAMEERRPRQMIEVQLPCGRCVHQGVCIIEEQLEQDLTLRIGVEDARSHLVGGAPSQPVELSIDCSWFDPRTIRPRGPRKPSYSLEERARRRERALRVRPWEHRWPRPSERGETAA